MPWVRLKRERCGFGRDEGPPPSIRLGAVRLSWWSSSWDDLVVRLEGALEKSRRALDAAKAELRR